MSGMRVEYAGQYNISHSSMGSGKRYSTTSNRYGFPCTWRLEIASKFLMDRRADIVDKDGWRPRFGNPKVELWVSRGECNRCVIHVQVFAGSFTGRKMHRSIPYDDFDAQSILYIRGWSPPRLNKPTRAIPVIGRWSCPLQHTCSTYMVGSTILETIHYSHWTYYSSIDTRMCGIGKVSPVSQQ